MRYVRALVLATVLLFIPCTAHASDEFQFWLGATTAVDLAKQWKATIGVQTRHDDRGDLVRHHSDLGVVYKGFADWLDVGLNYRAIFTKLVDEEWRNAGDFGTFRNRIMLNPPFELEPDRERLIFRRYTLKPYGGYEIFYDTLDNTITRHRFQGGLSVVFTDRIVGDISYIRENSSSSIERNDLNVVSASLKLLF